MLKIYIPLWGDSDFGKGGAMHYGYMTGPIYTTTIKEFWQFVILLSEYLAPPPMRRDGDQTPGLILLDGHRLHAVRLRRGEEGQHTSAAELVTTNKKYWILAQDQPALVGWEIHMELISTRATKQASQARKPRKLAKRRRA